MTVRQTSPARSPRTLARDLGLQRRNLASLGLLTGCILVGTLAAALWIRMVLL